MISIKLFSNYDDYNKICENLQTFNNESDILQIKGKDKLYPKKACRKDNETDEKTIDFVVKFLKKHAKFSKEHKKASIATLVALEDISDSEEIKSKLKKAAKKIKHLKQKTSASQIVKSEKKDEKENKVEVTIYCQDGEKITCMRDSSLSPLFPVRSKEYREELMLEKEFNLEDYPKDIVDLYLKVENSDGDLLPEDLSLSTFFWLHALADYLSNEKMIEKEIKPFIEKLYQHGDKFLEAVILAHSMLEKSEASSGEKKKKEKIDPIPSVDLLLDIIKNKFYDLYLKDEKFLFLNSLSSKKAKLFLKKFEHNSDNENSFLQFLLACCLRHGKKRLSKGKDRNEAIALLEKASEEGYAPAQYMLGVFYEHDLKWDEYLERSFPLYEKASDQGYALAKIRLALDYSLGSHGLEKNLPKAFELLSEGVEAGSSIALVSLAKYYYNEEQNIDKALELLKEGSDQGNVLAHCWYHILMYGRETGEGIDKKECYKYEKLLLKEQTEEDVELGVLNFRGAKILRKGILATEKTFEVLGLYKDQSPLLSYSFS